MKKTIPSEAEIKKLRTISSEIRRDIIEMLAIAKSGHPGGSLSAVEILVSLFYHLMDINPKDPWWEGRDRFHLSKGHACPALYAVLSHRGFFPRKELWTLRQLGSNLQGHPHPGTPGIEVASGSLGQGLSIACGMAVAAKLDKKNTTIFTVLGDGELQEGQVWEAALFAAQRKLDNLYVIIDRNGMQIDGKVRDIINVDPLCDKWQAFGFHTVSVDGHDIGALCAAVIEAEQVTDKPCVIIANTVKGKGVSFMEHNLDFHGRAPNGDETKQAYDELGGAAS